MQARRLDALKPAPSPVFILGLWRSGTTVLHELLAECTGWNTPRTWQCFHPSTCFLAGAPRGEAEVERPMDAGRIHTHGPQEDEFALLLLGEPSLYRGFIDPRRLTECARMLQEADAGSSPAETFPRWQLFLRGIASQSATSGLLLKSPNHCFRLPLLRTQFPDAKFVWIGRHSGEVLSSNLRMWRAMTQLHGLWDCPAGAIETFLLEAFRACAGVLARILEEMPRERLYWLDFEQLRAEPQTTLQRTLEFLGVPPPEGTSSAPAAGNAPTAGAVPRAGTGPAAEGGTTAAAIAGAGSASLQQALSRVPIYPGNRAALPDDEDIRRFEALMASARRRFGDSTPRRSVAG